MEACEFDSHVSRRFPTIHLRKRRTFTLFTTTPPQEFRTSSFPVLWCGMAISTPIVIMLPIALRILVVIRSSGCGGMGIPTPIVTVLPIALRILVVVLVRIGLVTRGDGCCRVTLGDAVQNVLAGWGS